MSRLRDRSGPTFGVVLVLTIAVAFLPAPFRLGWQSELARVVLLPVRPFSHAGNAAATIVMPDPESEAGVPPALRDRIVALEQERDAAYRNYLEERAKRERLEEQLRAVRALPLDVREAITSVRLAGVSRRNPLSPDAPVELVVAGRGGRVPAGTVAVHGGVHLLGRVVEGATDGPGICTLLPLLSKATGYVRGLVVPGGDYELAEPVHLSLGASGLLVGDVDAKGIFETGAEVRLDDPGWPPFAQMMVLGRVESRRTKDAEPLRDVIEVRPQFRVRDLAMVTLLVEGGSDDVEGDLRTTAADAAGGRGGS